MQSQSNILADLRLLFEAKQKEIRAFHDQGGTGLRVVEALSDLADHLLLRGFQSINPTLIQEWGGTMVAIGGCGRRELSPASDIDLMFLFPEGRAKQAGASRVALSPAMWPSSAASCNTGA